MDQERILAKLKKDIRSLLISSKLGLDPGQLRRDYESMLGGPLPLKQLGFTNVMDMVMAMPDVVSINLREDCSLYLKAVGVESTQNIEVLVAKQRKSKADIQKAKRGQRSSFSHHAYYQSPHVPLPRRGLAPPAVPAQLRAKLLKLLSRGPIRLSDLETAFLHCFGHPLHVQSFGFYSTQEMLRTAADLVVIHQDRLGSVVSLRVMPRPPAMMIARHTVLPQGTKKLNGTHPDSSVRMQAETRAVLPPVNLFEVPMSPRNPACSETVAPVHKHSVPLEQKFYQHLVENGVAGTISQEFKEKLIKVVSQAEGGLSVHDLPAEYKRLYGEDLPLLQTGFISVTELVDAMSHTFKLKAAENDTGQSWTLSVMQDRGAPPPDLKEDESSDVQQPSSSYYQGCGKSLWESKQEGADDEAGKNHVLETSITVQPQPISTLVHGRSGVPLDALQSQRLKKPTRLRERDVVQVLVEHVESPGCFYISFCDSEEARATEVMMIEMRRCYKCPEVSEHYALPERFVRRGQVCCVCLEGMWFYRVVIHQILSPTHVEVYFADFGNMTVVSSNSLKFLKSCYSDLPAQAVPSALTGIKPSRGSWTLEAAASFQKLCRSNPLVGALVCYTGDVLQLYLCDTGTGNDIYFHKVLLSEGHGIACSPSVSEDLCACAIPVSVYLGEGTLDLPEIEEPSLTPNPVSPSPRVEEEEVDLPALELIEDSDCGCHIQDEDRCSFSVHQSVVCTDIDPAATDTDTTRPPSAVDTPGAPPDLIQCTPTFKVDLKSLNKAAPTPSGFQSGLSCPPPQKEQKLLAATASCVVQLPPFWRSPDPHIFALGQGVLLNRLKTGFSFPVFGAR